MKFWNNEIGRENLFYIEEKNARSKQVTTKVVIGAKGSGRKQRKDFHAATKMLLPCATMHKNFFSIPYTVMYVSMYFLR